MDYAIVWAVLSIAVAFFAHQRGRNGAGWLLLALLISPLLAVILLALMRDLRSTPSAQANTPAAPRRKLRRCPSCAEDIYAEATRCRHCGVDLDPLPSLPPETPEQLVARYGIRREAGQYIYGKYRYNDRDEAIAAAQKDHADD